MRDAYTFKLDTVLMDMWSANHMLKFLIESDYRHQPVPNSAFKAFTVDHVPGVTFIPLQRVYGFPTSKHVIVGYDSSWPPVKIWRFNTSDPHFTQRDGYDIMTFYNDSEHMYYTDILVSRGIALVEPKSLVVLSTKAD